MTYDFIDKIENCIENNIGVTFQIFQGNNYIIGKETQLSNYYYTEYGLEIYDINGEHIVCPKDEPKYNEDEDFYYYNVGDLIILIIFNEIN